MFAAFAQLPAQNAAAGTLDGQLLALARLVVTDSLRGGGVQNGQHFVAADSLSAAILTSASVAVDVNTETSQIICPGSTTAAKAPMPSRVGYRVRVRLETTPDRGGWLLSVEKGCSFVYGGRDARAFGEGARWEIRRVEGAWRIVRTIDHFIT
jgi:hypothetical protein